MQDKYVGRILELVEYLDPTQAAMVAGKIMEFHGVEPDTVRLFLGELSSPNREAFSGLMFENKAS